MSDKIENKLKEIVKLNSKILEDIEKRLDAAGLKAAQSAVRFSSAMLKNISADDTINAILKRVASFGGAGGKAAANAFSKEFKKGVKETTGSLDKLSKMMMDVEGRMKTLSERKTAGWSKAAGVQREIMTARKAVDEQIALNKRLMMSVAQRANSTQDPVEQATLKNRFRQLKAVNKELNESLDLSKKLAVQTRQLDVEEFIQNKKEKSFGWIGKARNAGNFAGDVANHAFNKDNFKSLGLPLLMTGIFELFKVMVGEIVVAGKVFRDTGQTASQLKRSVSSTGEVMRDMVSRGLILPTEEAAKVVSSLQDNLGELSVPRELAASAGEMVSLFKMSSEEAGQLVTTLYRFSGRNATEVAKTLKYVEVYSQKNNLNAAAVMKDMAAHANDFANAGNMSAAAFARAAVESQRIGVNMSTMTSLANSLVNDFEGALQKQAELSTMFPGMDMTKVTYASQFGTNEDVMDEVKSMINGSGYDINALPRSFKNNLQKNLGMSASELANMAGSQDISKFASPEQKDDMAMTEKVMTKVFDGTTGGLAEIIKILKSMLFMMNPLSSLWESQSDKAKGEVDTKIVDLPNQRLQGAESRGMSDATYTQSRMFHSGGIVGKHGTPVGIPKFHGGLLSNEMFAILQKGEAVLTEEMQRGIGALSLGATMPAVQIEKTKPEEASTVAMQPIAPKVDRAVKTNKTEELDQVKADNARRSDDVNNTPVVVDTSKLEKILTELLAATKNNQQAIELDGQKVGKLINKSFSRSQ